MLQQVTCQPTTLMALIGHDGAAAGKADGGDRAGSLERLEEAAADGPHTELRRWGRGSGRATRRPGGVALLAACQLGRENLAGAGIDGQVQLAPRPLTALTVFLDQPLARAVDLQSGGVDHDVHRSARQGLRQRRTELLASTRRFRPPDHASRSGARLRRRRGLLLDQALTLMAPRDVQSPAGDRPVAPGAGWAMFTLGRQATARDGRSGCYVLLGH